MAPRTPEQFAGIREKRMAHILEAALHEFVDSGYHKASIAAIARSAGISKGLIYNYFSGKQELLEVLLNRFLMSMDGMLSFDRKTELDAGTLAEMITGILNYTQEDIREWKLYFALSLQPDVLPVFTEKIMAFFGPYLEKITQFYQLKRVKNPGEKTRYLMAALDGVMFHVILDPEGFPLDWVRQQLIKEFT